MTATAADSQSLKGPAGGDYLLEHLVRAADTDGVKVGVTLYIGGSIVTGLLVSGDDFLEGCAQKLREAEGQDDAKRSLERFIRETDHAQPPGTDGQDEVTANTGYVHLAEARVVQDGSLATPGVWWRGRIDCIDAFNLGVISDANVADPRIF